MPGERLRAINLNLMLPLHLLLEAESVSEAARRAGVTPSAMSHALAQLRALFDDPLLVRVGGRLRRTAFASTLRAPLEQALGKLDRMLAARAAFDPVRSEHTFTVSMRDHLAALLAPALMSRIVAAGPHLALRMAPFDRNRSSEMLEHGAIDAAVGVDLMSLPEVRAEALYHETFACLVWRKHARARARKLGLADYVALPHVLLATTGSGPGAVDTALAAHGLSRRVAARLPYVLVAAHALVGTQAVLTVARRLACHLAATLPLTLLEPPIPIDGFTVELAWHPRDESMPALSWLLEQLRSAAAGQAA